MGAGGAGARGADADGEQAVGASSSEGGRLRSPI